MLVPMHIKKNTNTTANTKQLTYSALAVIFLLSLRLIQPRIMILFGRLKLLMYLLFNWLWMVLCSWTALFSFVVVIFFFLLSATWKFKRFMEPITTSDFRNLNRIRVSVRFMCWISWKFDNYRCQGIVKFDKNVDWLEWCMKLDSIDVRYKRVQGRHGNVDMKIESDELNYYYYYFASTTRSW